MFLFERFLAAIMKCDYCSTSGAVTLLECHPLGSQTFVPLAGQRFVAVVAPPGAEVKAENVQAFLTDGRQSVHYHAGTWHHPLLNLTRHQEFLVIDREGPGDNCEEVTLDPPWLLDENGLPNL